MKRILSIALALAMLLALTACGGTEQPGTGNIPGYSGETAPEELPSEAATKTLAFFEKYLSGGEYTMVMKTQAEGVESTVKSAYSGEMVYTESEYDGVKNCMIMKEGYQYILDHSSKTCIKMNVLNEDAVQDMFAEEAEKYQEASRAGDMEYGGKTYYCEEFNLEDETVQYLFEGDQLKIIVADVLGTQSEVEILSIEKGADSKLFEIPEDYQMIAY